MDLEKIKSFYNIEVKNADHLYLNGKFISFSKYPLVLTFGNDSIKTIEAAKKDLNCIVTDTVSFYKAYFNLNDSEFRLKYYGQDERSFKYLEKVKADIGYLESYDFNHLKSMYDYIEVEDKEVFTQGIPFNVDELTIGKYKDVYVLQYYMQTEIDDYVIVKYFFNKRPKAKDIFTIDLIKKVEKYLQNNKSAHFKCWECGNQTHWLDVKGGLLVKAGEFTDSHYCGC